MEYALIKHRTSGDVYVATVDGESRITARTLPIAQHEYQDEAGELLPELDLEAFAVDYPEDEPFPAVEYRWLAYQAPGGDLVDLTQ